MVEVPGLYWVKALPQTSFDRNWYVPLCVGVYMPLTWVALGIQATHVVVPGVSTWTFSVQPPGMEVAQVT